MPSFIRASHVFLLAILTACAARSPETDTEPASSATVQVENQGFVPRYLAGGAGPIRFLADPIGGNRTPVSEEMSVRC